MSKRAAPRNVPSWIPYRKALNFRFTIESVRRLQAGPLTDTLVALRFMKYKLEDLRADEPEAERFWVWADGLGDVKEFRPSLNMVYALAVYDRLRGGPYSIELCDARGERNTPGFWYEVMGMLPLDCEQDPRHGELVSHHCWKLDGGAPTIEMCICKAALMTLTKEGRRP